ncbi:CDP-alcohol phosphatidyltransferase family protein [Fodinicurvata sp. EGI_FJ10296]|uniref:CDP-alcohol phosphatidyltransferase family protein n=1 Tax=Fodinicurvata sp. EGI_FJ10296 TaxID=3231908 RepID=UPI0034561118
MTLYDLKPRFQAMLRPMVARMAAAGVRANHVTVAAAVLSVLLGVWLAVLGQPHPLFILLPVWLFLRMAMNAIDGMLAREFDQATPLGVYLNEIGDIVSDAALLLPFAVLHVFGAFWVGLVIVMTLVAEYAGVLGWAVGAGRRYDGPFGKSDRALVLGLLGLWIGVGGALPVWLWWIMPAMAVLLLMTTINRVRAVTAGASGNEQ